MSRHSAALADPALSAGIAIPAIIMATLAGH
jgi:hypothetical protein